MNILSERIKDVDFYEGTPQFDPAVTKALKAADVLFDQIGEIFREQANINEETLDNFGRIAGAIETLAGVVKNQQAEINNLKAIALENQQYKETLRLLTKGHGIES